MLYGMIKNNNVKDVILLEKYNNVNVYEIIPMIDGYMINVKFVFTKNGINYLRNRNIESIRLAIDGFKSFLMIGFYEDKIKQIDIKNKLVNLCKNQNVKNTLMGEKLC